MAIAGFNATYYVQQYPDVLLAISQGTFKSAEEHFTKFGAKEGRNPNAFFDSKYYLAQNPDVLQAVAAGTFASAYDHYIKNGGAEGRVPSAALATFDGAKYLAANADVKTAGFTEKTAVSHYVLYGAAEGRSGTSSSTGQTVTLTTGQDSITGSDAADIIRGVAGAAVGAQDQTTLNSSDVIDGGKGEDTLVVNLTGNYGGGATIKNVETLQLGTNVIGTPGGANVPVVFDYNVNAGSYEVTGVNKIVADQITRTDTNREVLSINNITPTAADGKIPTLSWENEAGSNAGTVSLTYRAASVAGTNDTQKINLSNVNGGILNIGGGIETVEINVSGTARSLLRPSDNSDNNFINAVDLVSNSIDGVADNGSLKKVVVTGTVGLGRSAGVIDQANTTLGTNNIGLTNRAVPATTVGNDRGIDNDMGGSSDLVSVAATVTEIDASGNSAGVAVRFTARTDGAGSNVTFKGGDGADYAEFELGNASVTGGKGDDTFAFVTRLAGATNSTYGSGDTITGGEGSDTLQLGVNGVGSYTLSTTEFANTTGVDVLDLRGATSNVTLSAAVVAAADAGKFTVRTDRIVQTSIADSANPDKASAATLALEDNSTHTINITQLNAGQGISIVGGSGSDRIIGNNATINAATIIDGGTNLSANGRYDTLTVVNSAVLDRTDLANIKGLEGLVLVENVTGNSQFTIELTEAFLLANSSATRPFTITTATAADGQAIGANDTVTIDVTGLYNATQTGLATSLVGRGLNIVLPNATINYVVNGVTSTTIPTWLTGFVNTTATTLVTDIQASAAGAAAPVAGVALSSTFAGLTNATVVGGAGTDTLTVTDAAVGAIPANAVNIENLVLSNFANSITFNAATSFTNVTGGTLADQVDVTNLGTKFAAGVANLGDGNDTLTLGAQTYTGNLNGGNGTDILSVITGTNISGATVSSFETLTIANNATVTLNASQWAGFNTVNAAATAETVVFTTASTSLLGNADVEGYTLANGTNNLSLAGTAAQQNAVTVTGGTGTDTVTYTTDVAVGGNVAASANITNVESVVYSVGQTMTSTITLFNKAGLTVTGNGGQFILGTGGQSFIAAAGANDVLGNAAGTDTFTLGSGADIVRFGGSRFGDTGIDTVVNFKQAGADTFKTGVNATTLNVLTIATADTTTLAAAIQTAATGAGATLAANTQAYIINVTGGTAAGQYAFQNIGGSTTTVDATDFIVKLTGTTGSIVAGDFIA